MDLWQVTKYSGDESASIVGEQLRLHVLDTVYGKVQAKYQYAVAAGDFVIDIDIAAYTPDDATDGHAGYFAVGDDIGYSLEMDNGCIILFMIFSGSPRVTSYVLKNGGTYSQVHAYPAGMPTKLRIIRSSANMTAKYYYDGSWNTLSDSISVSPNQASIDTVGVYVTHGSNFRGGQVDYDNLMFRHGCPTGSEKVWTTTSTTTTMTSTTSTCTTTSTPPP